MTQNNSLHVPVIGQSFYDAVGRAAVEVLPVPMIKGRECPPMTGDVPWAPIDYYNGFNQAEAQPAHPFTYLDLLTQGSACTPLARQLDEGDGAELYYHPNSLNTSDPLFAQSGFIPKADGYPFVQTEYMPDNTGRVKRKGGVGPTFQLGGGHATRFMYGTPEQVSLDRLFGSEAPYASQCQKNVTIDANEQSSVTYLDGSGRTIATALAGYGPSTVLPLPSAQEPQPLIEDLFGGQPSTACDQNHIDLLAGSATFQDVIVVPADNMILRIDYDLSIPTFTDPCLDGVCYHCVYDLTVRLQDAECGEVAYEAIGMQGRFQISGETVSFVLDCQAPPAASIDFGAAGESVPIEPEQTVAYTNQLNAGTYILSKTLRLHQAAMDFYANDYSTGAH
ncbi:MAG: hypothetical protein JNM91_05930, partial [Flavobacteriales bacterium]|nr:hypothetical protein [Flavobacteriales bacterium]